VFYRGSHKRPSERIQAVREAVGRGEISAAAEHRMQLGMPPGALCVFQGTLLHGGGANRTDAPRLAFTNQYCEPWARPQENFFLGVPKERVRKMSREMQTLLGTSCSRQPTSWARSAATTRSKRSIRTSYCPFCVRRQVLGRKRRCWRATATSTPVTSTTVGRHFRAFARDIYGTLCRRSGHPAVSRMVAWL